MKVVWMRANDEGQTVFEDLDIEAVDTGRGFTTSMIPLVGAIFRTGQPGLDLDFHNAPRRQFVVPVGGEIEVEAGDGTIRTIASGEVLLADDLTGQGHQTRVVQPAASTLMLAVPDDLDPSQWRRS
ncbi:MAG: hypothetical protein ACI8TP_004252 [Acidimicrobiales bacterium]|jgi:hypothetical protein